VYILFKFISIEYKVILEENRPPGRPRSKWEDNIQMDLQGIYPAQNTDKWRALLNTVMNL
jgi:hypothetical protein